VSKGYQLNYCWILKLLTGPKNFKLLDLCGKNLQYTLADYVFVPSVLGENILTAEFGMISAEKLFTGTQKESNGYFYLPLYLPL
jgi:hypothetical protein